MAALAEVLTRFAICILAYIVWNEDTVFHGQELPVVVLF